MKVMRIRPDELPNYMLVVACVFEFPARSDFDQCSDQLLEWAMALAYVST